MVFFNGLDFHDALSVSKGTSLELRSPFWLVLTRAFGFPILPFALHARCFIVLHCASHASDLFRYLTWDASHASYASRCSSWFSLEWLILQCCYCKWPSLFESCLNRGSLFWWNHDNLQNTEDLILMWYTMWSKLWSLWSAAHRVWCHPSSTRQRKLFESAPFLRRSLELPLPPATSQGQDSECFTHHLTLFLTPFRYLISQFLYISKLDCKKLIISKLCVDAPWTSPRLDMFFPTFLVHIWSWLTLSEEKWKSGEVEKFSGDISELLLPDCEQWAYLTGKVSGTVRQCSQVQRPVMIWGPGFWSSHCTQECLLWAEHNIYMQQKP